MRKTLIHVVVMVVGGHSQWRAQQQTKPYQPIPIIPNEEAFQEKSQE